MEADWTYGYRPSTESGSLKSQPVALIFATGLAALKEEPAGCLLRNRLFLRRSAEHFLPS